VIILIFLAYLIINFAFAEDLRMADDQKKEGAHLQILNKSTTKNYSLKLPLGQFFKFSEKELAVYQCIHQDRKKGNDHIALIKFISESNNKLSFLGWLFKSSPSLVTIEDQIYDIKLLGCLSEDPLFPEFKEIK
tara:strand:- start:212 stop:613 length:402 start_codon:yes stop_codon:yes gene_type:complete